MGTGLQKLCKICTDTALLEIKCNEKMSLLLSKNIPCFCSQASVKLQEGENNRLEEVKNWNMGLWCLDATACAASTIPGSITIYSQGLLFNLLVFARTGPKANWLDKIVQNNEVFRKRIVHQNTAGLLSWTSQILLLELETLIWTWRNFLENSGY